MPRPRPLPTARDAYHPRVQQDHGDDQMAGPAGQDGRAGLPLDPSVTQPVQPAGDASARPGSSGLADDSAAVRPPPPHASPPPAPAPWGSPPTQGGPALPATPPPGGLARPSTAPLPPGSRGSAPAPAPRPSGMPPPPWSAPTTPPGTTSGLPSQPQPSGPPPRSSSPTRASAPGESSRQRPPRRATARRSFRLTGFSGPSGWRAVRTAWAPQRPFSGRAAYGCHRGSG